MFFLQCHIFLHFHTVHGVLKTRILKWFAISFSSGPHFVRTLHHDPSILGGATQHGSQFHWVRQGCGPCNESVLLMQRTDSLEKTLMLGKIKGSGEKGAAEGEIVGWHHWLDRHEFEQALGVSDGQGSLTCCSPWGCKKSDMTEWLNWTEDIILLVYWKVETAILLESVLWCLIF